MNGPKREILMLATIYVEARSPVNSLVSWIDQFGDRCTSTMSTLTIGSWIEFSRFGEFCDFLVRWVLLRFQGWAFRASLSNTLLRAVRLISPEQAAFL